MRIRVLADVDQLKQKSMLIVPAEGPEVI